MEIIEELSEKGSEITIYKVGEFTDLC